MYVYINSQGRVLETITAEQVNQGSDLANRIHFHVEGLTREQNPTVTAQFRLPNGTTVAKPISANVEDPGYVPESDFDYRVFKPDYPYLFWYCDLDSTLLEQTGTLFCSLIVQIGGQTVITTVQGMITIAVKESAVDDPDLSLSQYEYLLYWIGDQTSGKYVLKVGDTMTGPLSTPKITVDEISSDGETISFGKPIHFGSEIYSYSELGESGLTVRGAAGQSLVSPTEVGTSAGTSYIKFSFSGSNPIIETAVAGGSAIRNYMPSKSGFLGILGDDVASAYLGYRNEDGHLFLEITKQDGSTINSDVDLPLESAIVGMSYDHETQTITFTLTSGATLTVPVSDIFQGVVTLDNGGWARENQMSVSVVYDHLTNINGKALTSFASEPYDDGTYQGYYILTADDEAFLTKEQAAIYMKAMTGSEFVPEYDYDHPTNSYFVFASDKSLWKPQWSESGGLILYSMRTTMVDAESDQTIEGVKTFSNGISLNTIKAPDGLVLEMRNNYDVAPSISGAVKLGNLYLKWKEINLSNSIVFDTNTKIERNTSNNQLLFYSGNSNPAMQITDSRTYFRKSIRPYSNNVDIGGTNEFWNDLYLRGKITDGTNSFTPATIANLIKVNALAVAEESDIWDLPMTVPSIVGNGAVIDGSKMRLGALYGKCVAWNQMVQNGNFADNSNWSSDSNVTATYSNGTVAISLLANGYGAGIRQQTVARCVSGHKYLIKCVGKSNDEAVGLRVTQYSYGPAATVLSTGNVALGTTETAYGVIATATATSFTGTDWRIACIRTNGTSVSGDSITIRNLQVFDLTLIYGAGNEPTTAAQFAADFPEAYYAYDAGSIKGSAVTKLISRGKNLFDNDNLTLGDYNTTTGVGGQNQSSFRCINKIGCKSSTSYYMKAFAFKNVTSGSRAFYMHFWDADDNYIGASVGYTESVAWSFTTPANASKMALHIYTQGTNYNGNIPLDGQFMIVEGSVAPTAYEPYFKEELNIPIGVQGFAQRGIGGVQNELDFEHKKAIGRLGEVDLGTLQWTTASGYSAYSIGIQSNVMKPTSSANAATAVCSKYIVVPEQSISSTDKAIAISTSGIVLIHDSSLEPMSGTVSALSGVKLVYQLAEESVTNLSSIGDLGDFNPYLKIKVGGTVDCDCEVKPTLDASVAVYE